jgi:putative DNA primase/helicase
LSHGIAFTAGLRYLADRVPGGGTPPTVRWNGRYYQRSGVRYRVVTDEAVEGGLARWLALNPDALADERGRTRPITMNLVRDAALAVRSASQVGDGVVPGSWLREKPAGAVGPFLATPGGILDLGRLGDAGAALLPGSPDFFTLAALPVTPDPAFPCLAWQRFLEETFGGDPAPVRLLQEMFGYCLWPDCRYERFFLLYGDGGTGKSTTAETLQAMLGEENVSALPLERFGERFALAGLVGKMANVVFDSCEVDRAAEGTLKALVSGEPVTVEQKHCPLTTMRLTAKHLFVANSLPRFHDTTDGLWRRLTLIPFDRVCPPGRRDAGLKAKLREELPGIAHWALQGLARLLARGGFTPFEAGTRRAAEYRRESNPVALFLEGACVADPGGRVGRQALYARFKGWAGAHGYAAPTANKFYSEVRALFPQPEAEVRDGRGGDRMFVGVRLRQPRDEGEPVCLLAGAREGA